MSTAVDAGPSGGTGGTATRGTASTAELARTALQQAGRLVRAESRAGLAELKPKLRDTGTGVALFGAASVTVCYGIAALLASVTLLLALLLPLWAAALVVTVALFGTATVAALAGMARLRRAGPPIPDRTVESIRSDVRAIATAARRRSDAAARTPQDRVDAASPLRAASPTAPATTAAAAPAGTPVATRISDAVRRHPNWWAAVGAGVVATGSALALLRRRRVRRTPPRAPAVRAWRAVADRLGR